MKLAKVVTIGVRVVDHMGIFTLYFRYFCTPAFFFLKTLTSFRNQKKTLFHFWTKEQVPEVSVGNKVLKEVEKKEVTASGGKEIRTIKDIVKGRNS